MIIQNLELHHFRNYELLELEFSEHLNLIQGDNGQGKTNLAEALYYLCNLDSFRTRKVAPLLYHQQEAALIKGYTLRKNILSLNQINLSKKGRKVFLNHQPSRKTSEYILNFFAIAFTPDDVGLFRGSPSDRRRFFDRIISFMIPSYFADMQELNQILAQKNSVLKRRTASQLGLWNEMLAPVSLRVMQQRQKFIEVINQHLALLFLKMTGRSEVLQLVYQASLAKSEEATEVTMIQTTLQNHADRELHYGYSVVGPHRDDYRLFLDERGDRDFFSQGEMRVTNLALKMAINQLLSDNYGFQPVLIFDDLFSELDRNVNRNVTQFFLELKNQIFVTSTDIPSELTKLGNNIHIRNGQRVLS